MEGLNMNIINKFIMIKVWLLQKIAIQKLKNDRSINYKIIYYKNKNFIEEVWLDNNMKPHFISTQLHGINIDYGNLSVGFPANNVFDKNQEQIKNINNQINNVKEKISYIPEFPFSIKIEKDKK